MTDKTDPTFSRDMRKKGWKLLEHVPRTISSIDLELISILIESESYINGKKHINGENYINGEKAVRLAKELNANCGQEDAEWLDDNQHLIPKEWRNYLLIFSGTVWQDENGDRRAPSLYRQWGRWWLGFYLLKRVWSSSKRLLRSSK